MGGWVGEQAVGRISGRQTPRENVLTPPLPKLVTIFWLTCLSPDQGLNVMNQETRATLIPNHCGQCPKSRTQDMLILTGK